MRKSNNYFKFLEYVTYGKDHDDTIDKGNGVLECKSYASISDIEYRYNATFGLENDWLTFKNILIDEDTLYIYYLEGENSILVGVYPLDNFKTQKELKETISKACVEFLYELLLEKSEVREETEKHYYDYTSEDFIKAGIAKECTTCPDFCEEDCIENAECSKGYDVFDGCKTVKEVMEVKQELNARFGKEQYFDTDSLQPNKAIIEKIENINQCPNQDTCCIISPLVHCNYNYKSDSCIKAHENFIHYCEQVHKQMKAKHNPEWHHVSLATLANIDNNMLDDKRRLYLTVWGELNKTLKNLHKCNSGLSYERALSPLRRWVLELYHNKKITGNFKRYVYIKISMCNVECGVWSSAVEVATGQHESRKYNKPTLRY